MTRLVTYEWVVEEMDGEDIVDTSGYDTLGEAQWQAAVARTAGVDQVVICLRRDVGEGPDREHLDIVDRQYAYPGDTQFEYGAAIPKRFLADFNSLPVETEA